VASNPERQRVKRLELFRADDYFAAMPIYEFHCEKCERDSEILVRSSAWKGTKCPHCGSTKLAKRLSVFASSAAVMVARAKRRRARANPSLAACVGLDGHIGIDSNVTTLIR
jgi:putative FmdB family regulatory protein